MLLVMFQSTNNDNQINSTSTEMAKKDERTTLITTATTNKTVTNWSFDDFDFWYHGVDYDDSDEDKFNCDDDNNSKNMSENHSSTNVGFVSADIFNLERNIDSLKEEDSKEISCIIEHLHDNYVRID